MDTVAKSTAEEPAATTVVTAANEPAAATMVTETESAAPTLVTGTEQANNLPTQGATGLPRPVRPAPGDATLGH